MNKIIISAATFLCFCMNLIGQTFSEINTQYPIVQNEGSYVVTGFQAFNYTDDVIFANTLKWASTEICTVGRDHLSEVSVPKKQFSFNVDFVEMQNGKAKYTFYTKGQLRVTEGKLVYTIHDIQYKTGFVLATIYPLDRLSPDKKPKHKEIMDSFQKLASKMLNQLFDHVFENNCKAITHWDDIAIQRPVKGMNTDECILAFGKPQNIYESDSNGVQWSYNLNNVLIFKNDVLETIIR